MCVQSFKCGIVAARNPLQTRQSTLANNVRQAGNPERVQLLENISGDTKRQINIELVERDRLLTFLSHWHIHEDDNLFLFPRNIRPPVQSSLRIRTRIIFPREKDLEKDVSTVVRL